MSRHRVRALALLVAALLLPSCGKGGSGSTGPDLSVLGGPGGFDITGTWSGSFGRPNGSAVTLLWTATQDSANFRVAGPLALTLNGVTATGTLTGNIGAAPSGVKGEFSLSVFGIAINPGGVPGFPSCQIVTEQAGNVSLTSSTFSSGNFMMRYSNCDGLIEKNPGSGPVFETAQLTMTKQAGAPAPAAGQRWLGVAPDGMILEPGPGACTLEMDLQLDLTTSGTAVTGTATTKERKVAAGCGGLGSVETWTVTNGKVGSGSISFSLPATGQGQGQTIDFSGTFTATRMTGTVITFGGRRGTFALNRQ
jgi:hypothetical protein